MKIILALALGLASAMAQATVVTYSFNGIFHAPSRFTMPGASDNAPLFNGLIKEGERFSGQFTFDTAAAATKEASDQYRWALYPLLDFKLKGSDAFNAAVPFVTPSQLQVTDNHVVGNHTYDELIPSGSARVDAQHTLSGLLRIAPANNSAFQNFRVPVGYQDFANASLSLYMYHWDNPVFDYMGADVKVTLLDAGAVPEPATGMLLLAGLGGFAALRRRRD